MISPGNSAFHPERDFANQLGKTKCPVAGMHPAMQQFASGTDPHTPLEPVFERFKVLAAWLSAC
jgi:hypothetical protein